MGTSMDLRTAFSEGRFRMALPAGDPPARSGRDAVSGVDGSWKW